MTQHFPLMVPGCKSSHPTKQVFAPFDGQLIATIDDADQPCIETALATAAQLFANKRCWLNLPKRIDILEKTISLMQSQREYLATEAAREGGKPLMDSLVETDRAIDGVRSCIDTLRTEAGHVIPMQTTAASLGHMAFTQKEPIGVVVAVSAFNHPLNLIVHQVAAAVAAGCPVIVKPASDTPLSCMRFVKLLHEAGLPEPWCQAMVISDSHLATLLVSDARVGFLSFIGSAKVGWMLRSKLAPGARCALEHGGVAPVIVDETVAIETVIPALTKGGFYHAGQVCVSVQKVFAHRKIAKTLAEKLATAAKQLKVGDPTLADTDVGPIIRHSEVDRIDQWVNDAVTHGAQLLCGGSKLSDSCYQCTVLLNPKDDATISQQEIFGPVVCVYEYDNVDDAIARANALPFAFQAAVFSEKLDFAIHAYKQLNATAVMVNNHSAFRVDAMPFAGARQSGLNVGGIPYSMEDMQIEKMMVIKSTAL